MKDLANATLHAFPREREESPYDLSAKGQSAPLERGSEERETLYASLFGDEAATGLDQDSRADERAAITPLLDVLGQIERLACGHLPEEERASAGAILLESVRDWLSDIQSSDADGAGDSNAEPTRIAHDSERDAVKSITATIARSQHEFATWSARRRSPDGVPRARVLVFDADPVTTRITLGFLATEGYAGAAADSGKLALERLAQERFDALLIDLSLTGMDGFQVATAIRQLEAERRSPSLAILAVAGDAEPEVRSRCLESGMNAILCKPLRQGDLDALLQIWVPEDHSLEPS